MITNIINILYNLYSSYVYSYGFRVLYIVQSVNEPSKRYHRSSKLLLLFLYNKCNLFSKLMDVICETQLLHMPRHYIHQICVIVIKVPILIN